jgi:hypothetical protein
VAFVLLFPLLHLPKPPTPGAGLFFCDVLLGRGEGCLSPLNSWTKFKKQFCNQLNLGNEQNQKKIHT